MTCIASWARPPSSALLVRSQLLWEIRHWLEPGEQKVTAEQQRSKRLLVNVANTDD